MHEMKDERMTNGNGNFAGKAAFVTGGGTGIGRAAALAFAREGASVAVAGRTEAPLKETVRLIEEAGGRALAVTCDVSREEEVKAAVAATVEAFGRLDLAFNNAGVEQTPAPAAELDAAEFDRIVGTDLRGVFLCMKHEIPPMLEAGGGAIVNVSSGAGIVGIPGNVAYTAAKHGVVGMTKAAALDYATSNIRVNAVCPGYIDTPMMDRFTGGSAEGREKVTAEEPIGRVGRPEEVAAAALWLCSDAAAFVVGHALVVDGGQTVA